MAELFTGSQEVDAEFSNKLGISALIREAMHADDSWDLGRLIHRYSGIPVGSVCTALRKVGNVNSCLRSLPQAMFVDCTHDNETPAESRTAEDSLSTAALVAMTHCGLGSVHGYDILRPRRIDLVQVRVHMVSTGFKACVRRIVSICCTTKMMA